ncbi:MAG: hypothetical protein BWK73_20095 [Thiothrix lacustris]|uniref:Phage tail collar domain-containing protein n=1 Tax=Thiothrix lacustris TaxID=525917 RepID=A0A1Y1QP55_9GAMM|nr:MAG: hypothetical protein BWK73_20095 [Thiothrix lacustris]
MLYTVIAGITVQQLGKGFTVDPVLKKVHTKSAVSADAGNGITVGADGSAFMPPALIPDPIDFTVADGSFELAKVVGATPVSAADLMLVRQGDALVQIPYAELGAKDAGSIAAFELANAPSGWLALNGQTVNGGVATYPDLAAVYPTWVSGANLVLPDYRGLHLEGAGTDAAGTNLAQSTAMPTNPFVINSTSNSNHTGATVNNGQWGLMNRSAGGGNTTNGQLDTSPGEPNLTAAPIGHTHGIGGGDAKTRPASRVVLWCVKAMSGVVLGQAGTEVLTHTLTVVGGTVTSNVNGMEATAQFAPISRVAIGAAADPNVSNPLVAPIEGETYIQSSDGTATGTFVAEWRYKDSAWLKVNPVSQTFFGLPNPNTTSPTPIPQAGHKYILTSNGTSTGVVQSVWEYTGTTWIQIGGFPTSVSVPDGAIRTYFPSYTALQHKFPSAMTTAPAAYGFTAVGGAVITNWGSFGTPAYRMFQLTATKPTCTTSANTLYSIPTSYVRHEVAVNPNTANQYMLQLLSDANREVTAEVWLCDPATGVPAKRLYANTANESGTSDSSDRFSVSRAPDNASAYHNGFRLWVGWEIPKSLIDTYKTGTNTIKLAIRPGADNGETNTFYINGYAMVESKYAVVHMPALVFENTANIAVNRNATTGGNQLAWWQDYAGYGQCYVTAGQNRILDIPVTDTSKDIYLTVDGLQRDGTDSSGHGISEADFSIVHTSGDVALGRPRLDIKAPITGVCDWGHRPMGFLIPAATLAAKATNLHANSAVQYLRVRITQPAGLNGHLSFLLTEQVS